MYIRQGHIEGVNDSSPITEQRYVIIRISIQYSGYIWGYVAQITNKEYAYKIEEIQM